MNLQSTLVTKLINKMEEYIFKKTVMSLNGKTETIHAQQQGMYQGINAVIG